MPATDTGYYECRAMNAVAREPAVARTRVIVISGLVRPIITPTTLAPSTTSATPTTSRPESSSSTRGTSGVDGTLSSTGHLGTGTANIYSPWYEQACPRPHYCLNGGQCTYIKPLAEYYCR